MVGSAVPAATASSHVGDAMRPSWPASVVGRFGHGRGWLRSPFLPVLMVNVSSPVASMARLPSGFLP
jgi:hypothetical protein